MILPLLRNLLLGSCLLLVVLIAQPGWAQPASGEPSTPPVTTPMTTPAPEKPEKKDPGVVYLPNAQGEPVPVPANATLEQYLEWVKNQKGPQYYITNIVIKGDSDEKRANLEITIQVQINRENEWIRVPLKLNEAILQETSYKGNGEASFDKFDRDAGYFWWFKGKGVHELHLKSTVPIVKQLPTRRLHLAMPLSAASQLTLAVPHPRVNVTPPANAVVKTINPANSPNLTEIEMIGLGDGIDLQWLPLPNSQKVTTILQSFTSIAVEYTGDTILLTAYQQVQAVQGTFREVNVHLPPNFELLELDLDGSPYNNREASPSDPLLQKILLPEETTGPVELKWTLEAPIKQGTGKLTLSGFEVDLARRQTGEILLRTVQGFRFARGDGDNQFVYRINASDLSHPQVRKFLNQNQIAGTFRFLKPDFKLVLEFLEIEPYYTIQPKFMLTIGEERIDLSGTFQFQVYRGTVQRVELKWATPGASDWDIEPVESPGLIERVEITEDEQEKTIHIWLLGRQSGIFEIPLKAHRKYGAPHDELALDLPTGTATSRLPSVLTVQTAENITANLTPKEGTQLVPQTLPPNQSPQLREFRLPSTGHALNADITIHDQIIRTSTLVRLQVEDQSLVMVQKISYDIAYERLEQIRLKVPQSLAENVQFFLTPEQPLLPTWTGLDVGSLKEARFRLPSPALAHVELFVRAELPLPEAPEEGVPSGVSLPLVQSSDARYSHIDLQLVEHPVWDLKLLTEEGNWKTSLTGNQEWTTSEPQTAIPLTATRSRELPSQNFRVRRALVRTLFDLQGHAHSRAQYQLEGEISSVVLQFPKELEITGFWWENQSLKLEDFEPINAESGTYRLDLENHPLLSAWLKPGKTHLVTIEFRTRENNPFGWSHPHRVPTPRFSDDIWVEQTIWQVAFPSGQHMFTNPDGLTPQNEWQRSTVLWSRQPTINAADLEEWIGADNGPPSSPDFSNGNLYVFSCLGRQDVAAFRSISRTALVALGAGLALVFGFVLTRIPLNRSVLTLLIAGFVIALIGLWFPAPIQLLLQPAGLGMLLAVITAFIDHYLKRERTSPVLAFPHSSEMRPTGRSRSGVRSQSPSYVSEGSTEIKPLRHEEEEPVSSSPSGKMYASE